MKICGWYAIASKNESAWFNQLHLENPYTNETIEKNDIDSECTYNAELAILNCRHPVQTSQFLSIFKYLFMFAVLIFIFSVQINFVFSDPITLNGLFMGFGQVPIVIIIISVLIGYATAKSRLHNQ